MTKLILKPAPIVAALMDEMRAALIAIENGNYDDALEILEARCRPKNLVTKIQHDWLSLGAFKVAKEALKMAPEGFVTEIGREPFNHMAHHVFSVLEKSQLTTAEENLISALNSAVDFGLLLDIQHPETVEG